jgi:hypothetical protein
MDALNNYYKNSLLGNLCGEYKNRWRVASNDKLELLKLSLCQQSIPHVCTFAYEGKGLTKEYIKENFGAYINGYTVCDADDVKGFKYGLYVDYDFANALFADKNVCSLMWCKDTNVVIPTSLCPVLYVSNKSDVSITGEGFNAIRVYLFDESVVNLDDFDENSSVLVYKYSKDARVEIGKYCLGKVKIFDKELKI